MKSWATNSWNVFLSFWLAALTACGGTPAPEAVAAQSWTPVAEAVSPSELLSGCEGDSFHVDLAQMIDATLDQGQDEGVEQWRDLLFPILLARMETRDGLEGLLLNDTAHPLIRDDALAHVLDQSVGSARTAVAKDGTVVVMVEDDAPALMHDALLDAIDQEALDLQATPKRTIAYRYALDEMSGYAQMCVFATLDGDALESAEHGFRRATLDTTRDLEAFLAGGVDLTSAQCTADGLEVTGRNRPRTSQRPIRAEHIAVLHRPRELDYVPITELQDYLPKASDDLAKWLGFMSQMVDKPSLMKLPEVKSKLDAETTEMLQHAIRWKRKHRKVPSYELVLSWIGQNSDPRRLGFSLDPKMRAKDAARSMAALRDASDDPREFAALFYAWNVSPREATDLVRSLEEIGGMRELFDKAFSQMHKLLLKKNVDALGSLTKWKASAGGLGDDLVSTAVQMAFEHDGYQCARYDGPLQGTEVGMTMFYTDLLMKLWSGDRFDSAPDGLIPGFESVVGHDLSEAHCSAEEKQYSNTRAWLGLREEQYAREAGEGLRFAPIVARVFARSSQYGAEYSEEVEATAGMRRFYRWWNAHYAQVAAWEPQYELLNQIMKWSVVVQNAELSEHRDCLGFLDKVKVERGHRFDQWVKDNDELRWRGPLELVHEQHETTECIPLLRSRSFDSCGGTSTLVGGVSVASKAAVKAKRVRRVPAYRPRSRLDASASKPPKVRADGSVTYESVTKANGTLHEVHIDMGKRSMSADIDLAQTQRGMRHSYHVGGKDKARPITEVAQTRRVDSGRLVAHDTANQKFGVAQLETGDLTRPTIKAQVKRLEVTQVRDLGGAAAERLARSKKSLSHVVGDMPQVHKAWKIDDHTVLVRLDSVDGSAPYALMSSGGGIRGPPAVLHARMGRSGHSVEVSLIGHDAAKKLIKKGTKLQKSEESQQASRLNEALQQGQVAGIEARIDTLVASHPEELGTVRRSIRRARINAARRGQDTGPLDTLALHVELVHNRPTRPVLANDVVPADAGVIYVPRAHAEEYADLAALPPGTRPSTGPGTTHRTFHARMYAEASAATSAASPRSLPEAIRDGDDSYVRISLDGREQRPWTRASRLRPRHIYVIDECDDAKEGDPEKDDADKRLVRCYGRDKARDEETSYRDYLREQACGLGSAGAASKGVRDCGDGKRP